MILEVAAKLPSSLTLTGSGGERAVENIYLGTGAGINLVHKGGTMERTCYLVVEASHPRSLARVRIVIHANRSLRKWRLVL